MKLWRISRHRDLEGLGGLRASGRWHYPGQPVVYLSESAASALLEVCVHTAANDIPPAFTLLCVEGPEDPPARLEPSSLPADWTLRPELTRELGTAWLRRNESVLLELPSAIVPNTRNYLFNPVHPAAIFFRIVESIDYPFDARLKK